MTSKNVLLKQQPQVSGLRINTTMRRLYTYIEECGRQLIYTGRLSLLHIPERIPSQTPTLQNLGEAGYTQACTQHLTLQEEARHTGLCLSVDTPLRPPLWRVGSVRGPPRCPVSGTLWELHPVCATTG